MRICFEGIDGCGKTTQIRLLEQRLIDEGFSVATMKHPGSTPLGAALREILLAGLPRADVAARLLFLADAVEAAVTLPEVDVLVFDRHVVYSNVAYGAAMGTPPGLLEGLAATLEPWLALSDVTFFIDVPVVEAFRRLEARGSLTAIERRGLAYFERVRRAYLELALRRLEVVVLDGTRSPEEIHSEVWRVLKERLQ